MPRRARLWDEGDRGNPHRIERRACHACLWQPLVDVADERPPR